MVGQVQELMHQFRDWPTRLQRQRSAGLPQDIHVNKLAGHWTGAISRAQRTVKRNQKPRSFNSWALTELHQLVVNLVRQKNAHIHSAQGGKLQRADKLFIRHEIEITALN